MSEERIKHGFSRRRTLGTLGGLAGAALLPLMRLPGVRLFDCMQPVTPPASSPERTLAMPDAGPWGTPR